MADETLAEGTKNYVSGVVSKLEDIIRPMINRLSKSKEDVDLNTASSRWVKNCDSLKLKVALDTKIGPLISDLSSLLSRSVALIEDVSTMTDLDVLPAHSSVMALINDFNKSFSQVSHSSEEASNQILKNPELALRLEKLESRAQQIYQRVLQTNHQIDEAEKLLGSQLTPYQKRYQEILSQFEQVEPGLIARSEKLDDLVRLAGKKVLAGSYDARAIEEETSANLFRRLALWVMGAAVIMVAVAYLQTAVGDLTLNEGLMRLGFSLVLSIPAAYMARELSRHRQHQYMLQQTALDIGAIDAYISTLPHQAQDRIKEQTAVKLFTPKNFGFLSKDSYPINTQELAVKIVDAITSKTTKEDSCLVPCDHIPRRSWPLFRAKAILNELIADLSRSSSQPQRAPE